ncbi:MAG: nitrogen regulation protein NR(II) [Myxococcota bacterium]
MGLRTLQSPTSSDAARASLAKSLFAVAALRLAVVSLVLVVLVVDLVMQPVAAEGVGPWRFGLVAVTYGLSVIYLVLLRFTELVRGLAYLQVVLDAVLVTALVVMTQGTESPFTFAYVFVVLTASMTLYRPGGLLAAATTSVLFGGVMLVQLLGSFGPLPSVQDRWGSVLLSYGGHTLGMLLMALLASTLAEKLRSTGEKLAQKEQDLRRLGDVHASILAALPAGVMTVDASGRIHFVNDAACQILGLPRLELTGVTLEGAVPAMAPAWRQTVQSRFKEPSRARFEADFNRGRGEVIRLGFSVAPLDRESESSAIIVFQDVTDVMRLKDAVARSERLALVGKFAAGLAHEVRNPLASMCASIDVLAASLDPPESVRRLMSNVTREADRLNGLITDFLALARPRTLHVADQDFAGAVTSVLDVFENELDPGIRLVRSIRPLEVRVDADLMLQVVWNLIRNARDAVVQEGGTIWVETGEDSEGAFLRVADDGPGVTEDLKSKIFDPFYTTKERGSGLGLAISNSIVEAHGAEMWFDSRVGAGTRVTVRFTVVTSNLPLPEAV